MTESSTKSSNGISELSTEFVQSNGIRMAYQEFGRAEDPVVLLVAGLYNQLIRWPMEFCDLLVAHGFRVIRSLMGSLQVMLLERLQKRLRRIWRR